MAQPLMLQLCCRYKRWKDYVYATTAEENNKLMITEVTTLQEMELVEERAFKIEKEFAGYKRLTALALADLYLWKYNAFKGNLPVTVKSQSQAIEEYLQSEDWELRAIGKCLLMKEVDKTDKENIASMYYSFYIAYKKLADK